MPPTVSPGIHKFLRVSPLEQCAQHPSRQQNLPSPRPLPDRVSREWRSCQTRAKLGQHLWPNYGATRYRVRQRAHRVVTRRGMGLAPVPEQHAELAHRRADSGIDPDTPTSPPGRQAHRLCHCGDDPLIGQNQYCRPRSNGEKVTLPGEPNPHRAARVAPFLLH